MTVRTLSKMRLLTFLEAKKILFHRGRLRKYLIPKSELSFLITDTKSPDLGIERGRVLDPFSNQTKGSELGGFFSGGQP